MLTGELADPRPAYAAGDILLGMGGSALRAMAFAKPLVVLGELGFALPVTPETVDTFLWQGFYGLGDGDRRPEGLADLLRPLLADPARRGELGAFARQWVEGRFSLVAAGERQEQLYGEWLTGHTAPRDPGDRGHSHRGSSCHPQGPTTARPLAGPWSHRGLQRGHRDREDRRAGREVALTWSTFRSWI